MRRYPIGSSTDENQSNQHYYVASSQQISPKKTWTQRLKFTKSDKSITSPSSIKDISSEFAASTITLRSMKYAEPWLYGTVRGIPARPAHGQPIFAPIPTEVAVVVCSCPEYLSGTKKEIKKASICKKCKGSRLPLAPIGGTVRIASTTAPIIHKSRSSAGTMRLPSTSSSKLRPSILDPQNDPYDLMRRTRLLSPEPKLLTKSSDKSIRNRAKSTSPTRGRSRTRLKPAPPPPIKPTVKEVVPLKSSKNKIPPPPSKQDCWLDTLEAEPGGRRSILHCNVNPYDLISSSSTNMNEFSPHADEDDDIFNSSRHIIGSISRASGKTVNYSNIKAIAGQRIILGDENIKSTPSLITQTGDKFIYDGISLKKISNESTNQQDNEKLKTQPSQQQQQQQKHQKNQHQQQQQQQIRRSQQSPNVNEKTFRKLENLMDTKQQPKRPPRRKHDNSSVNEDNEVPSVSSTKPTSENSGNSESHCSLSGSLPLSSPFSSLQSQISSDSSVASSQKQAVIKSILKRPSSLSVSVSADKDTKNSVTDSSTTYNDSVGNFNSDKTSMMSTNSNNETKCNDKANGSQFYLPFPTITTTSTRKKVQFMVEDKIISDESEENLSVIEANKNCGVKMTSPPPPPPPSSSTIKAKERTSFHQNEKQQQNKHQEILESQQKDSKLNGYGSVRMYRTNGLVGEKDNSDKEKEIYGMVGNEFDRTESVSDVMVNGKAVSPSSSPLPSPSSLSTGIIQPNVIPSNENCVVVIKQENGVVNKENINEDAGMMTTECNQDEEKTTTTDLSTFKKLRSLRRTHSDRRSNNTTTITLNFNDTMALRAKQIRVDSRDLFSDDMQQQQQQNEELEQKKYNHHHQQQQQRSILKQKNEIPVDVQSPVTAAAAAAQIKIINNNDGLISDKKELQNEFSDEKNENQQGQIQQCEIEEKPQIQIQNVQHQQQQQQKSQQISSKKIAWQENCGVLMIKNNDSNTFLERNGKSSENKDKSNTNAVTDGNSSSSSIGKINRSTNPTINYEQNSSIHQIPQAKERKIVVDENLIDNIVSNATVKLMEKEYETKDKEKEKLLQAQNEIYNGTRLFGNQNKSSNTQKTVVRVAPFNKTSSEIHRLKIQHQDDSHTDDNMISQKKTSIFINGDDCYSTVNVSSDTPIYQSSVVVTDVPKNSLSSSAITPPSSFVLPSHSTEDVGTKMTPSLNTVTISVCSSSKNRTPEEDIIYKNNKINTLLSQNITKSVIPISNEKDDSGLMTATTTLRNDVNNSNVGKRIKTLITLGSDDKNEGKGFGTYDDKVNANGGNVFSHEEELVKILRNPVEAVKRNLVPHVCGKTEGVERVSMRNQSLNDAISSKHDNSSFIGKLLQDSTLSQLAEGLDNDVVIKLIEKSLKRLKDNRNSVDTSGTKDNDDMTKLIDTCLQKIKDEKLKMEALTAKSSEEIVAEEQESQSNRGSISSGNSYSSANYELFEFENNESDCYQSCSSEITGDDDTNPTRNKFYQMLVDATLSEIEISTNLEDDHHYESIRLNGDPIYEEISEIPPPLPLSPPPVNDPELDKKNARSMFEGASKYDILSYLVDAKERGIVREESYEYNFSNTSDIIVEEEIDTLSDLNKKQDTSNRISHLSITSDSSEDTSLTSSFSDKTASTISTAAITTPSQHRKPTSDIERNDSGVGSETSKSSRSKYQNSTGGCVLNKSSPIHLCEDCDGHVETQITDSGVMYAPLVCRKCGKKRAERKEIITEIVETEEKYGRDLQIILEEFCQPMLVAGLLTQEQLSAIFLNTEELLENNQALAEKMRDALDIALEQGDDDLLTVNIGKIFLECTPMLHAFETYCVRQAAASLLLANLEKEKELLRIFLKVSQMENTVLRRMNLNSFLMVPVQRVTKYPLLLARLYKVTPPHLEGREVLKQAQEKIELHLNHMNQEAKDVPTKLWRRISSSSPNRRASCEIDMINIKLRKMAIDILEWNHDEVRFAMEGKLLFTQPTDNNWKKGRTIKLTPVNALLVTNGKPSANYKAEKAISDQLNFPKHTGIREAALLLVKEKCGRYTLIREPLYLDRCVICTETDWDDYFEVHEISSKDTFIFKAEDGVRSKQWYTQLQYHAQGMGAWRKRRNALANIMINGMLSRT